MIRIGFLGILYYIVIIGKPQNSIGNSLGPYMIDVADSNSSSCRLQKPDRQANGLL